MLLRDALGRRIELPARPARVVSLVPSITESLFDLGAGDVVVGVTDWCIFPERIRARRVGGTKNPMVEEIRELSPDLVHMNLEENLEKHARAIEEFAPVFVTEPASPRDVGVLFEQLGLIHDVREAASAAASELALELERPPLASFSFAVPIWKLPWMWCGGGTYVSALVETLGGRNVLGDQPRYPALELAAVLSLRPDAIVLPDEPFAFTEVDALALSQVFPGRVAGPFPGHYATWHGTRTVRGLRFLRELLSV